MRLYNGRPRIIRHDTLLTAAAQMNRVWDSPKKGSFLEQRRVGLTALSCSKLDGRSGQSIIVVASMHFLLRISQTIISTHRHIYFIVRSACICYCAQIEKAH
eukprot:6197244-Pleurochrysis_carterae.AAC.1